MKDLTVIYLSEDHSVECYGMLQDNSNFLVVCEDEYEDSVWLEGNPYTGEPFKDWQEVVEVLADHYDSEIYEISAV